MQEQILLTALMACLVTASGGSELKEVFSKYKFHYKTGDSGEHTRTEESDDSGRVIGMYSYKDPNGVLRTIQYRAAPEVGYQAYGEGIPLFGNLPLGNYASPTNLPASQPNSEDKGNETFSGDYLAQGIPLFGNLPLENYASPTNLPASQQNREDSGNETFSGDYVAQASEVTDMTIVTESSTELMESSTEPSTVTDSSTEPSTASTGVNHNMLVPVLFPYGSFHKILIHSGHLYYSVPQSLAYSLVAPDYRMVL